MIPVQLKVCNKRYIVYNNLLFNVDPNFLHDKRSEGQTQEKVAFQERAQREALFVRKLRSKHLKDLDAEITQQIPTSCFRLPVRREAKKPNYRRIRRCCSYGAIVDAEEPQLRVIANCLKFDDR